MHTPLCKHAVGEPEEYVRRAIERGIGEIGFSDHSPMPADYDPNCRMTLEQFPEYIQKVVDVRRALPSYPIKLGLEADFHPGMEDFVYNIINEYDFDYVIGSVHYIGDWGFDNPANIRRYRHADLYDVYRQYFHLVVQAVESGLFDVLGHPDLIKKFGFRPQQSYEDLILRTLQAVKKAKMALDVNTSGLRRACREIYPSRRFLELARELDVPVTLGSDAHDPQHVGQDFDSAVELLRSVGYTQVMRFTRRRAEAVPL
ncbi:MAG: histidinol-phosphatase HisJ family protein [Planctomycetes bacterium]|nr:histidinol-phosphatase HisJ family protein [Planctomycetota bacterium]